MGYLEDLKAQLLEDEAEEDRLRAKRDRLEFDRIAEDVTNKVRSNQTIGGKPIFGPGSSTARDRYLETSRELEGQSSKRRSGAKDLINRIDAMKLKEDEDKRKAKEWDYKLERDREADRQAREKLDFLKTQEKNKYDKESRKIDRESALYKAGFETNKKALDKAQTTLGALEAFKAKADKMDELAHSDNKKDIEKAYSLGKQMVKQVLNAEFGTGEAVGVEEAKNLAGELDYGFSNLIKHGKLRDAEAFIDKVKTIINTAGAAQKSLYDKAYQRLESEDFQPYEAKFLEEKRETKKPETPKVGDRFIDPETGIEMIYVEED